MDHGAKFSLSGTRIQLSDGQGVQPLAADATFWKRMTSDSELREGRMLGKEPAVLVGVTRHADTQHRDVKEAGGRTATGA